MSMPIGPVKVNLVKDAELRFSKAGNEYIVFSVAYNERVKNPETGEWGSLMWENPQHEYDSIGEFMDVRVFKREDNAAMFEEVAGLKKGDFIDLVGKRSLRGYINKAGERKIANDVIADAITVVNRKDAAPAAPAAPAAAAGFDAAPAVVEAGEPVPF